MDTRSRGAWKLDVEAVNLGVGDSPKEAVQLGGHPVVVVADLPAHVAEVDEKPKGGS